MSSSFHGSLVDIFRLFGDYILKELYSLASNLSFMFSIHVHKNARC